MAQTTQENNTQACRPTQWTHEIRNKRKSRTQLTQLTRQPTRKYRNGVYWIALQWTIVLGLMAISSPLTSTVLRSAGHFSWDIWSRICDWLFSRHPVQLTLQCKCNIHSSHRHHHHHRKSCAQCLLTFNACFVICCQLLRSCAEWLISCRFDLHHFTTSSVHFIHVWTVKKICKRPHIGYV